MLLFHAGFLDVSLCKRLGLWLSVLGARVGLRVRVAGLGFGVGSGFRVLVTVGVLCIFEYGPDLGRWALGFRVLGR